MGSKLKGKLEASGRAGIRDKRSDELIAVYPHKVTGTDQEIEDKVKYWFYQRNCEAENQLENYYIDTLTPLELKNSQEKFED